MKSYQIVAPLSINILQTIGFSGHITTVHNDEWNDYSFLYTRCFCLTYCDTYICDHIYKNLTFLHMNFGLFFKI